MNRRLVPSRRRRIPGLSRTGQHRPPAADLDRQRLSLYLPAELINRAESLASEAGAESVRAYCEDLLRLAIEEREARRRIAQVEARRGPLEGLDAIANDPDYLVEWTASAAREAKDGPPPGGPALPAPPPEAPAVEHEPNPPNLEAAAIVLHHAALAGEAPPALLASLRSGEAIAPDAARELLQALIDLERALQDSGVIDRRLAFALHRLAFEAQVLITDGWPALGNDAPTVETLRLIQEAVDRVLSGDDIRYYPGDNAPAASESS